MIMKKIIFTSILLLSYLTYAYTQNKVVLTIDDEAVGIDEFERIYKKNNLKGDKIDEKSLDDYMNLYINFKLKVKEAQDLRLDTLPQ